MDQVLSRFSLGQKLWLAPIACIVFLFIVSGTSLIGLKRQAQASEEISEVQVPKQLKLLELKDSAQHMHRSLLYYLAIEAGLFEEKVLIDAKEKYEKSFQQYKALLSGFDGNQEEPALSEFFKASEVFFKDASELAQNGTLNSTGGQTLLPVVQNSVEKVMHSAERAYLVESTRAKETAALAESIQQSSQNIVMVVFVAALLISTLATYAIRNHIVLRLKKLTDGFRALGKGSLSTIVDIEGKDEFAQTAAVYREVAEQLGRVVHRVQESTRSVYQTIRTLEQKTDEVDHNTQRQTDATGAVAAAIEEMTTAIASMADSARLVSDNACSSLEQSQQGARALGNLSTEMNSVRGAFGNIDAAVHAFVQSTSQITAMTAQVKDLAEQTNLLALNAAIEAARAGEQGRGFSVVADEVRKLAERSAEAANNIDRVTQDLERQANEVEKSLALGGRSQQQSEAVLVEINRVISNACTEVASASKGVSEISLAVEEQSAASTQVARDTEAIARMTEGTRAAFQEASSAVKELGTHARLLSEAVSHFDGAELRAA